MNPVFLYKEIPYTKIVPAKRLFNSTTVHEVVTRGDFFALNLLTGIFTVLPQGADHGEIDEVVGAGEVVRSAELYESSWYKRQAAGYTDSRETQKKFVFPLDLLPDWCLQGVHLYQAVSIRTIKGKTGKEALLAEAKSLGSNQFKIKPGSSH